MLLSFLPLCVLTMQPLSFKAFICLFIVGNEQAVRSASVFSLMLASPLSSENPISLMRQIFSPGLRVLSANRLFGALEKFLSYISC